MENFKYYSQEGQDKFVDSLLKGKRYGVFVEVGAYDGETFSNSLFFEKYRGWSGVCIEPNPDHLESLKRRGCILETVAISNEEKDVEFFANTGRTSGLSGIIETYHPQHRQRLDLENRAYGSLTRVIKVKCVPLQKILDKHNIKNIDYLSVDVEGGELQVLQSIDFNRTNIDIIGFEGNYKDDAEKCINFLQEKGYHIIKVGLDIFMRKQAL